LCIVVIGFKKRTLRIYRLSSESWEVQELSRLMPGKTIFGLSMTKKMQK